MFNTDEMYANETQKAQLYSEILPQKQNNNKLIFINLLLGGALLFGAFKYFEQSSVNSVDVRKQAVLGVSETIDDTELSDDAFLNSLTNSMELVTAESSIKSQTSYSKAIARELDDRSGFRGKIAVVNQSADKF